MKTTISIFLGFIMFNSNCLSQITEDYPFKTFLDSANYLYVTGFEQIGNSKDIYIAKYSPDLNPTPIWYYPLFNSNGDDRGLDIAVDINGNTFVTGYTFNNITNRNDIIVIALNSNGTFNWSHTYHNIGDDKGMGIEIAKNAQGIATEVFITGYVTTPTNYKDIFIKKYNAENGNSEYQKTYGLNVGDDIATDILLDGDYAHVIGYSYFGPQRMNDIALLTFRQGDLALQEALFDNRPGSDEKPTGFIIAERSTVPAQKSKIALTSVTDNSSTGGGTEFLTMFLEPSFANQFIIRWQKEYMNCKTCRNDIATSIGQDFSGDIYVAGYVDRSFIRNRGYDFATLKYKSTNGGYGWTKGVRFYNYSDTSTIGVNDKASSIKINNNKTVYVSGVSEASPSGFSYVQYLQTAGDPVYDLDRVFTPNFILNDRALGDGMNKWSTMHLANDGTPLMVVMGWDETNAYWSAIRYDANGNVLYTINNETGGSDKSIENIKSNEMSLNNFPNPFNPSTVISYSLVENGFVNLKVYNILGKEVASLVNEKQNPGNHSTVFNAGSLSSGMYYYTMAVNGIVKQTKRMMLLK